MDQRNPNMHSLAQFVISVFELAEAEGRDLRALVRAEARDFRTVLASLGIAIATLLVSVSLFVLGAGLLVAGLLWWLETQVSRPQAAGLAGLAVVALGFASLFLARSLTKARNR
jgi:hypothetical protein